MANLERRGVLENTVKLVVGAPLEPPRCARPKQFVLGQDDDLAQVLKVLKRIAARVAD